MYNSSKAFLLSLIIPINIHINFLKIQTAEFFWAIRVLLSHSVFLEWITCVQIFGWETEAGLFLPPPLWYAIKSLAYRCLVLWLAHLNEPMARYICCFRLSCLHEKGQNLQNPKNNFIPLWLFLWNKSFHKRILSYVVFALYFNIHNFNFKCLIVIETFYRHQIIS